MYGFFAAFFFFLQSLFVFLFYKDLHDAIILIDQSEYFH